MSDEAARRFHTFRREHADAAAEPRRSVALGRDEAMRLLAGVPLGRVVFTRHALPAIRPVNHVVDDGDVVISTHEGATLAAHTQDAGEPGVVVAYEADAIDADTRLGWSVVVTGYARLVTDPRELARLKGMLRPWVAENMDYTVRIHPDLVTGVRLTV